MQTRSITRKLASASVSGSRVSNDISSSDTARPNKKRTNDSAKNVKPKTSKKKLPEKGEKMVNAEPKKRRSRRLQTDEERTEENKDIFQELKDSKSRRSRGRSKPTKTQEETVKLEEPEDIEKETESPPVQEEVKMDDKIKEDDQKKTEVSPPEPDKVSPENDLTERKSEEEDDGGKEESPPPQKKMKVEEISEKDVEDKDSKNKDDLEQESNSLKNQEKEKEKEMEKEEEKEKEKEKGKEKGKGKETILRSFEISISKLPEDVLNSVREKKIEIGKNCNGVKQDKKKQKKKSIKRILDGKDYIPLDTKGATKFCVSNIQLLKNSGLRHPAVDVKRDLLYGPRIKRVPYSTILAYNAKRECREMRH